MLILAKWTCYGSGSIGRIVFCLWEELVVGLIHLQCCCLSFSQT